MPYLLGGAFILGILVSYFLFARPLKNQLNERQIDLQDSHRLLQSAKDERETLNQKVADLEYKLGQAEKDLAFERGKKSPN